MNFAPGQKRQRRIYENVALVAVRKERVICLLWTRRGRKSTTLGNIGFDELSVKAGRTVIAASASLLLGTELVSMTVTATEQALMVTREAAAVRDVFGLGAAEKNLELKCADQSNGKVYAELSAADFAELYQSKRLEMRLYFDRTAFSRLMVIAPNPATARGWGGTVVRDEAGFTRASLETELKIAVDPIFRTDPTFKMIYASNLPRDDRHPYFEMTLPPPDADFPPKAEGHFYRGQDGILIHRVSLADAYAAGHVLYDNKGAPMTYEQFCAVPSNRIQLPGSYQLTHEAGGTAAIDLVALLSAQQRGARTCAFVYVDTETDFQKALRMIRELVGTGPVGLGVDVATTTGDTSNPTSVTVTESRGAERLARAVIVWKEKKPQVARERIERIIRAVASRPEGGPARRMCIDGSNERYFAEETRDLLQHLIPVEIVVNSVSVEPLPPGYQTSVNYKTFLGDRYCAGVNDGRYSLPSATYLKDDHRLTTKNGGRYECVPDADGKHGDTFDSGKLADYALESGSGEVWAMVG